MKYQKVKNGIIIIKGKVNTGAVEITATKTDTSTKHRIISQVISGNTRRGTPKSLSYIESSHFVPAKFGESFFRQFNLAMQLRKEELKKQGKVEAKVTEVMEDIINAFWVTKDHMLEAVKILETEGNTENSGHPSAWLSKQYGLANYGKSADKDNSEVLFIQTGSTKGTTFKINVDGLVFLLFLIQAHRWAASNMIQWPHSVC